MRAVLRRQASADWRGVVKAGWISTSVALGLCLAILYAAVFLKEQHPQVVALLWLEGPIKIAAVGGGICGIVALIKGAPWHGLGIMALSAVIWLPDFLAK